MMTTEIVIQNYSSRIKEASNKIASIVGSTLGPGGKNVMISSKDRTYLTKDGVSVARNVKSTDPLESAVFRLIKESAERTNTTCGDGTTTTTIFCDAFISEIANIFANKNFHYDKVYKDIETCLDFIYKDLERQSKFIETEEDIEKIARLSSNDDEEISNLVKKTLVQVGIDGTLSIKESKTPESKIELTNGYSYNSGFASQEFINTKDYKFNGSDCIVFMYQGKLVQSKEVESLISTLASDGRPIIIVAEEIEQSLLSVIMFNNAKGSIKSLCIEAPYFGHKKTESIKDLSIIVGGTPLHPVHNPISNFKPEFLGHSKNVIASKQKTLFIGNSGDHALLAGYIEFLKECLKGSNDEQEESEYTYRINQLSSSVVTIWLGANTPVELQEKKLRLEDALEAATISLRGGVVPGCCAALLRSVHNLMKNWDKLNLNYKFIAFNVETILTSGFEVLIKNMNYSSAGIKESILNSGDHETYDLRKNRIVDAYSEGCIEPLFVNIQAIKNSYSLAKVLVNSTCGVFE